MRGFTSSFPFQKSFIHSHGKGADGVSAPRWHCLLGVRLREECVGLTIINIKHFKTFRIFIFVHILNVLFKELGYRLYELHLPIVLFCRKGN